MAATETIDTGGQRQPKYFPGQEMTTVQLACLVVAFLVLGPLETSAKGKLNT